MAEMGSAGVSHSPRTRCPVRFNGRVEVATRADELAPNNTLQYRVDEGPFRRLVYAQLMHTEHQTGDSPELQASARVFATGAGLSNRGFTGEWRRQDLVRIWDFDAVRVGDEPLSQLPCTDTLLEPWYARLMVELGAID